jgi:hypothetical protein
VKKETVRTILIVVGVLVLLAIVGLGSAVWLFMRSFGFEKADQASAAQQFDTIRGRFAGVTPVLEIRDEEPVVARRPQAEASGTRLTTMHIVAWDPDDDDFVRISLPFWLLRLKSGPIEISSDRRWMGEEDLGITVEELERYGPTLVLDLSGRRGARVMVWTE